MKKVLIVSHLPVGPETNVGKTLYNLFVNYPQDKLAEVYFKEEGCTIDIERYHISDYQVLNSLLNRGKNTSQIIQRQAQDSANNIRKPIFNLRSPFLLLVRDFVWLLNKRERQNLIEWVKEIKPDAIFLAPGYSGFPYDLARCISNTMSIPLYIYFMEDFYNERRFTISPFFWIRYFLFRKTVNKCVSVASKVFSLNDALSREFRDCFNRPVTTIFNPAILNNCHREEANNNGVYTIVYAGSIGYSRIEIINKVGDVINTLSKKYPVSFYVYGYPFNKEIEASLRNNKGIHFMGATSSEKLAHIIKNANAVLHVESFEKKYIAKTKKAFSTKIPEYLASGNLVIAIGPKEIESIHYLSESESALIIDNKENIQIELEGVLSGKLDVDRIISNAREIMAKNHNPHVIQKILYNEIND